MHGAPQARSALDAFCFWITVQNGAGPIWTRNYSTGRTDSVRPLTALPHWNWILVGQQLGAFGKFGSKTRSSDRSDSGADSEIRACPVPWKSSSSTRRYLRFCGAITITNHNAFARWYCNGTKMGTYCMMKSREADLNGGALPPSFRPSSLLQDPYWAIQ